MPWATEGSRSQVSSLKSGRDEYTTISDSDVMCAKAAPTATADGEREEQEGNKDGVLADGLASLMMA